jgi:hypothetical protein
MKEGERGKERGRADEKGGKKKKGKDGNEE